MRKIKVLLTLLVSMAVFGANAFALGSYGEGDFCFEGETVQYSGSTATINVYVNKEPASRVGFCQDAALKFNLGSGLSYDLDANNEAGTGPYASKSEWVEEDGCIALYVSSDITEWNAESNLLCSFVVSIVDPNGDLTVSMNADDSYLCASDYESEYAIDPDVVVTLVAEGGSEGGEEGGDDDVAVNEGATANGITEYTFENSDEMSGKKVLMTSTAATVTESTRFYVSYQGAEPRVFGSDIWEKLAQGGGSVSVANVKFGLIVSEGLNASDFEFEVK